MLDDIGKDVVESGFSDLAGDAFGVDSHTIELGLELAELLDGDVCKQAVDIDVAGVVAGESKAGKRRVIRKRNQGKQPANIDSQEVQQ